MASGCFLFVLFLCFSLVHSQSKETAPAKETYHWTAVSACGFGPPQNSSTFCIANESSVFNWTSLQCYNEQNASIYRLIQTNPDPPDKAYTSMGYPVIMPCTAKTYAENLGEIVTDLCWVKLDSGGNLEIPHQAGQWRFIIDQITGNLSLGNAQYDNGSYECHVKVQRAEFVSRTILAVRDCQGLGNPCEFGGNCRLEIINNTQLKILRCDCVTQYTGPFCDKPIPDYNPIVLELWFYAPIIFYFACLGVGFLVFLRFKSHRTKAKTVGKYTNADKAK